MTPETVVKLLADLATTRKHVDAQTEALRAHVAEQMRRHRKESLRAVAAAAGVSLRTVWAVEQGHAVDLLLVARVATAALSPVPRIDAEVAP